MRAYITPDHGGNEQVPGTNIVKQASGARSFAFRGTGDLGSLAEQSGVFPPKHFGAKTYCRVDLGLPEAAVGFRGVA